MSLYVDSINLQALMINQILDEISAKLPVKDSGSSSSKSPPPYITDMEKLTVSLYGLGDDYNTTREILENDPDVTFEFACRRLKEKAEFSLQSGSSSSSGALATHGVDHTSAASSQKHRKRGGCDHCGGRHPSDRCYQKFPHLRPNAPPNAQGGMSCGQTNQSA